MLNKTPPGTGSLGGGTPFNSTSANIIEIAVLDMGESLSADLAADNGAVVPQRRTNRRPFIALPINGHMIADGHAAISSIGSKDPANGRSSRWRRGQ
jgi:hypothetical protein